MRIDYLPTPPVEDTFPNLGKLLMHNIDYQDAYGHEISSRILSQKKTVSQIAGLSALPG